MPDFHFNAIRFLRTIHGRSRLDSALYAGVDKISRADHHGALRPGVSIMRAKAIGLDFGTTNSAIAQIAEAGTVSLASFPAGRERASSDTMRSILYFAADPHDEEPRLSVGGEAIDNYIASGANGRLIQSLKSFLADRLFHQTNIMGDAYTLEDLITPILKRLRAI